MWDQPHYTISVEAQGQWDLLQSLETSVPGTLAWGIERWIDRRGASRMRRLRIERTPHDDLENLTECEIYVPLHGAWLIGHALALAGLPHDVSGVCTGAISGWDNSEEERVHLEEMGRRIAQESVDRGELRPHVIDMAPP